MKHLNYIYIIILLVLVAACSKDDEGILNDGSHSQGEGQTSSSVLPGKELRGVWIATVWGLDWPMEKYDADVQKKLYTDYLDLLVGYNMNAVFFQIRGMADAFYESEYEPWSKYITGSAGVRPDYDVLGFLVEEAHKRGIQFHAWLNPYRIRMLLSQNWMPKYPWNWLRIMRKSEFIILLCRKFRNGLQILSGKLLPSMTLTVFTWMIISIRHWKLLRQ